MESKTYRADQVVVTVGGQRLIGFDSLYYTEPRRFPNGHRVGKCRCEGCVAFKLRALRKSQEVRKLKKQIEANMLAAIAEAELGWTRP